MQFTKFEKIDTDSKLIAACDQIPDIQSVVMSFLENPSSVICEKFKHDISASEFLAITPFNPRYGSDNWDLDLEKIKAFFAIKRICYAENLAPAMEQALCVTMNAIMNDLEMFLDPNSLDDYEDCLPIDVAVSRALEWIQNETTVPEPCSWCGCTIFCSCGYIKDDREESPDRFL